MLERLKKVLVSSFVGAIAPGWVFAQGILHFAYVFSAPVASWLTRRQYHGIAGSDTTFTSFSFKDALPELIRSLLLLLTGYVLLRWLYYKPLESEASDSRPSKSE